MAKLWIICCLLILWRVCGGVEAQKGCPMPKAILPCRCLMRGEEYQIWCTHSDLPSVLEGLRATAKYVQDPIDEVILENNYLPALPGRTFVPLKILRLMLRNNGLERVSNDWLGGLEPMLMELFVVEPKLRSIPEDSLVQLIALQAVTMETELMKRLPLFSGLPKLRYLQIESTSLLELSPQNFKDNPSLEKLHIGSCPRLARLEANLLRDLPSLRLVNISYCGITWMHPRSISRLPVLQELVLVGNRISDAGMVGMASRDLPQLEVLRLDENYIDRLEEASFVDLPVLSSLHLSNNRIIELHRGAFHRVPRLRKVNLNRNSLRRVHPESFMQESRSGLEELWLVGNEIGHVADLRALLDTLPRLVFLDMSYNHLEAIPFGSIRGHPTLEHLNLDHNLIHLIDRDAFVAMPALRELRLRNNSLSSSLLAPLWNLPELKGLDLSGNFFRKLEPNFLAELPSLRKIDLSGNELTFIDPAAFTLTPSLEHINISYNSLATTHPATFRHLLGLYELDISNNQLIEFVPGLPRGLEYLHLKHNYITIIPLPPTPDLDLPALRMLDLTMNKIDIISRGTFATLPQLRRLYLGRNFLIKLEDGSLKGLGRLETLDLHQNSITHLSANAFKDQTELRDLNLGYNRLDLLVPEILNYSPRLKRLNLTKNLISEILPGTLDSNKELQMIDVSNNKLIRLSSTFIGLKSLRVLDLTRNRLNVIDPEILGSLPSLRILRLSYNFVRELKENAFNKLQHLSSLDMDDNEIEVIESNAVKALPILKRINLSRNKIKEIPNLAFTNLPFLQVIELQENQLRSIAPMAFASVPHLLMLNVSYNQIPNLEEVGLHGAKSLEMLDISHNEISTVSSPSLEKMEWLVELRIDDNKICGVQGSPFNHMPRLRLLSIRNNRMMSFPERAVERIHNNIAVLDIDGNPLACACNMLWLQAWLHESASMGPRCADGALLREINIPRQECPEEERNIELVAPGCEAELLSAPGLYGTSQVFSQWQNLKAFNNSEDNKNRLAPSPEESEYFYDDYVDYPYNDSSISGKLSETSTVKVPISTRSPHMTTGDTPTIYAISKNKNSLNKQDIPKEVQNSPSSSGFTFFGLPLPSLNSLLGGGNARKEDKAPSIPLKMDDRIAIVNKRVAAPSNAPRMNFVPPNSPKVETGGFVPILPGSGGFRPIPNPMTHQPLVNVPKDTSSVESMKVTTTTKAPEKHISVPLPTTSTAYTTIILTTIPSRTAPSITVNTNKNLLQNDDKIMGPLDALVSGTPKPLYQSTTEQPGRLLETGRSIVDRSLEIVANTTKQPTIITTAETVPETTTSYPIDETTILKMETTTPEQQKNNFTTKPVNKEVNTESSETNLNNKNVIKPALLIPGSQQSQFKMATITKVPSPHTPSSSATMQTDYEVIRPMAHNREAKKAISTILNEENKLKDDVLDTNWYFANYNTNGLDPFRGIQNDCCSLRDSKFLTVFIVIFWVLKKYFV